MRVEIVAYGLSVHSGDFLFPRSKEPSGHACMSYGDCRECQIPRSLLRDI